METAEKREFTAQGMAGREARRSSGCESPGEHPTATGFAEGGRLAAKRGSWGVFGIDGVGRARIAARECEGKTVRQLSRLWRYVGGGRPVGEGVAIVNGVGKGMGMGMM